MKNLHTLVQERLYEELIAMCECSSLLLRLDREEFERVMAWIRDRYDEAEITN